MCVAACIGLYTGHFGASRVVSGPDLHHPHDREAQNDRVSLKAKSCGL